MKVLEDEQFAVFKIISTNPDCVNFVREVYLSEFMPKDEAYEIPVFTAQDTLMITLKRDPTSPTKNQDTGF